MRTKLSRGVACGLLLVVGSAARAGTIINFTFNNDATSQIDSSKIYTAKADPGPGPAATINGVAFDLGSAIGTGTASTYTAPGVTYVNTGGVASLDNNNPGGTNDLPSGNVASLLTRMIYTSVGGTAGAGNVTTLTFSGLTAGTQYSARIYYRSWDTDADLRTSTIAFDEDGAGPLGTSAGPVNEDSTINDGIANVIGYNYTAVAGQNMVVTFTEAVNNNSWHLYGMSNEVVPEPASLSMLGLGALGLLARRRRG